jgi:hypothetical protein
VSLYGEAIKALRPIIPIDERLCATALDLVRISHEVVDLRERMSRLEGMLAASLAGARGPSSLRDRRRLRAIR